MIERLGRRVGFAVLLIEAAVFMTIWIFAHDKIALWLLGMAWSWGFIGVGGPGTALTRGKCPPRISCACQGLFWVVSVASGGGLLPFGSGDRCSTCGRLLS